MQQLSFFSFDNESEENKKSTKKSKVNVSVNKKIIDIKTKDYKVNSKVKAPKFDFESTMNRVNELEKIISENSNKGFSVFKYNLELGKLLNDLFLHKPYIYKDEKKVTFWDYLEIDYYSIYGYIKSFHIYNLLKTNSFKLLPNDREHIYLIDTYSDSQIIEIWEHLTINYKKITEKNISDTIKSLEKTKELETIEYIDINYSYAQYKSNVIQFNSFDMMKYYQDENKTLSNELYQLKQEKNEIEIQFSNHLRSAMENLYKKNDDKESLRDEIRNLQYKNNELRLELHLLKAKNLYSNNSVNYTDIYLKVLNLKSDYTQKDLKDSYNNHIKIYHPDKNVKEEDNRKISFENHFKLVKEAHDYLKK